MRRPRIPWPTRRQVNLLLLVTVVAALLTGTWLFASDEPLAGSLAVVHGIIGFVTLVLSPRKRRTIAAGLSRARSTRGLSLVLLTALLLTVLTGLGHSAGWRTIASYPVMHVHVIAAITAGVLVVWHAISRPARPVRTDLSRRSAAKVGVVGLASLVGWLSLDRGGRVLGLPGAVRRGTGSHERSSFDPEGVPGTIWFNDSVPRPDLAAWRLDTPRGEIALTDLVPVTTWTATLDCTSGWFSVQDWAGVPLVDLLGPVPAGARSILVRSLTGYGRRFPLGDRHRLLLAIDVGGRPLAARHGAPARLVAPGRRGFWWVKWVATVGYDERPDWAQPPFPLT